MKNRTFLILFSLLLYFQYNSNAQEYSHRQLTTQDGLPTNYVYGTIEDEEGYIWVYTEKGISKFDGYKFKNYTTADGLPINDIFIVHKNKEGNLWMLGVENSAAYIKNDSIFKIELEDIVLIKHSGNDLIFRNGGSRWIAKDDHLVKRNYREKIMDLAIKFSREKQLYEFTPDGNLFSIDSKNSQLIEYNKDGIETKTPLNISSNKISNRLYSLHYLHTNQSYLLLLSSTGILIVDEKTKKETFKPWSDLFKLKITRANITVINEEVYISTNAGLAVISSTHQINSYEFPELAKNYSLRRSYKDKNKNIWVGTKEGGLFFFSAEQLQSKLITAQYSNDNIFKHILKGPAGKIVAISSIGTVYDVHSGEIIKAAKDKNSVYDASISQNDKLIITSTDNSVDELCLIKECTGEAIDARILNHFGSLTSPIKDDTNVKDLLLINSKELYYSNAQFTARRYIDENNKAREEIIHPKQRVLFQDPNSTRIYTADKESLYFITEGNKLKKLTDLALITSICPIGNTQLVLGTESEGLFLFSLDQNKLEKIGHFGSTTQIRSYDKNTIYTSSNKGVYKLEFTNKKFKQSQFWGINQGLPSLEVFDFLVDQDLLYACTNNGIAKINLTTTLADQEIDFSKLQINSIKSNGKILKSNTTLSHTENDISIDFALLDIKSFGNIRYRYKLSPIQQDWQSTSDQNLIFNNLAPDEYSFNLEAYDSNNNHYKLENELNFEIQKAYWQTTPFFLLCLVSIGGILFLIDRKRKDVLNKELEVSKKHNKIIANLKLEALRSQMNPHFVFNALGAIQYYIQTHKIDEADDYLTLFANLMRKYLNSSSEQFISLDDEISLLEDYINLEKMRFEGMFKTSINIDQRVDKQNTFLPSMMIQPYIENAINHGLLNRKDGLAELTLSIANKNDQDLIIEIKDNGIGRKNAEKYRKNSHKSKGMMNVAKRIESLKNAELVIIDINISNNFIDDTFPGTRIDINLKNNSQWNTQLSS